SEPAGKNAEAVSATIVANSLASRPSSDISSIIDGSNTPPPSSISSVKTTSVSSKFIDCDISKRIPSLRILRILLLFRLRTPADFSNQQKRSDSQNSRPADNDQCLGIDGRFRPLNWCFGMYWFGNGHRGQLLDSVLGNHAFLRR